MREVVYIETGLILFSNAKTKQTLVDEIAAAIDPQKFGIVTVYKTGKGFLLTDGNHRTKAAIKAGYSFVPAVLLTKKEFDHVKYSDRTLDFMVKVPDRPRFIKSL